VTPRPQRALRFAIAIPQTDAATGRIECRNPDAPGKKGLKF
jgi:hypothetical protein